MEDYYGEYKVHLATADWRDTKYWVLKGICVDSSLSVSSVGARFVGYLLDAKKLPTLANSQLQIWLDTMASFSVFDEKECVKQPAMRKEYNKMVEAVKMLAICDWVTTGDLATYAG